MILFIKLPSNSQSLNQCFKNVKSCAWIYTRRTQSMKLSIDQIVNYRSKSIPIDINRSQLIDWYWKSMTNSWSNANFSFQFIASYVWYSIEKLTSDLLFGLSLSNYQFSQHSSYTLFSAGWENWGQDKNDKVNLSNIQFVFCPSFQWLFSRPS